MRIAVTLATLAGLLALGTACEEGGGSTVEPGTECPQPGYVTPQSTSLTLTGLSLDGLPLFHTFEPDAEYDGQPASCYDSSTNTARLELLIDDEPTVVLTVGALAEGSFDLNGTGGILQVDVTNQDGTITRFGPGDWQGGSAYASTLIPLDIDVSAGGINDEEARFVDITFTLAVTP